MSRSQIIKLSLIGIGLSLASIFLVDYQLASPVLAIGQDQIDMWNIITDLGDSKWMGLLLITLWMTGLVFGNISEDSPLWPSMRKKSLAVLIAVAGTGAFAMVLKVIVGRARPYMGDIGFFPFTFGTDFASWPSGHTTTAFAFAAAAGMAIPILRWPLLALAALIGYSRMTLGVHYLGDVIMGATIGTVGAVLIYTWLRQKLGLKD